MKIADQITETALIMIAAAAPEAADQITTTATVPAAADQIMTTAAVPMAADRSLRSLTATTEIAARMAPLQYWQWL